MEPQNIGTNFHESAVEPPSQLSCMHCNKHEGSLSFVGRHCWLFQDSGKTYVLIVQNCHPTYTTHFLFLKGFLKRHLGGSCLGGSASKLELVALLFIALGMPVNLRLVPSSAVVLVGKAQLVTAWCRWHRSQGHRFCVGSNILGEAPPLGSVRLCTVSRGIFNVGSVYYVHV